MDRKYWERVAEDYDGEIFDSLAGDRNGVLLERIHRRADVKATAFDFGCGVGKYLPSLSRRFGKVWASDLSAECVRHARALHGHLGNVSFLREDLSDADAGVGKADFVLCTNVLIMPSAVMRERVLKRLARVTRKGGTLLMLVPSLESSLLAHVRRGEWMRRRHGRRRIPAPTTLMGSGGRDVLGGTLAIDGVRTKHYLREELEVLLSSAGWNVTSVDKVEYGWNTEFPDPPRWMRNPWPWDWLAECRKK